MKRSKFSPFRESGMTLTESLMASGLLLMGILALTFSLQSSFHLVLTSKYSALATRSADSILATLQSQKRYDLLYQNYKIYDDQHVDRRFYILSDGSIDWSRPTEIPTNSIGEGYLEFVTNEYQYDSEVWGTDTAFQKDGELQVGKIDLDGNGIVEDRNIVLGRTSGSIIGEKEGYYIILPVRVIIKIYGVSSSSGENLRLEKKGWLFNRH